jgi:sigma-B regulation protein RsbU (phosphoserine phosphatase)
MADVSGKGIGAALFMMVARTLIKTRAQMGGTPSEILRDVNNQLCEGNMVELFVTVWLGILEISTGKGLAVNAGHEHPAIRRKNGEFELVVYKHSPAVATLEGISFREHEFEMHPGDTLFVYTDGVAEATNSANELFGNERMLAALNKNPDAMPEEILNNVMDGINSFVAGAEQFDDITMLCIRYNGLSESVTE